ncbi:hypothetical protein A3Q56_04596 [Intoshia linei]|uniref:Uncharacterized protein n=1 Tax=Intoshia linei TaxID=1819745 RepID=A0A177B072_9BILA|nr:hypothetical protein A3Q56_04596 [Intoshia linei]
MNSVTILFTVCLIIASSSLHKRNFLNKVSDASTSLKNLLNDADNTADPLDSLNTVDILNDLKDKSLIAVDGFTDIPLETVNDLTHKQSKILGDLIDKPLETVEDLTDKQSGIFDDLTDETLDAFNHNNKTLDVFNDKVEDVLKDEINQVVDTINDNIKTLESVTELEKEVLNTIDQATEEIIDPIKKDTSKIEPSRESIQALLKILKSIYNIAPKFEHKMPADAIKSFKIVKVFSKFIKFIIKEIAKIVLNKDQDMDNAVPVEHFTCNWINKFEDYNGIEDFFDAMNQQVLCLSERATFLLKLSDSENDISVFRNEFVDYTANLMDSAQQINQIKRSIKKDLRKKAREIKRQNKKKDKMNKVSQSLKL